MQVLRVSLVLCSLVGLGCSGSDEAPAPGAGAGSAEPAALQITAADREAANLKFTTLCFTCHGTTGMGDGPASQGLEPTPRNFQDPEWQASVTDEHIEKIIVSGGIAVGKALTMPGNPDLKDKPGVVAALREHIRSLAKN